MEKSYNNNITKAKESNKENEKHLCSQSTKNFGIYHKKENNKRKSVQSFKFNYNIINEFLLEKDKAMEELILSDEISDDSSDNLNYTTSSSQILIFTGTFKAPSEEEDKKHHNHHHHHRHKSHLSKIKRLNKNKKIK